MNDLETYSDQFILSQLAYYKSHLGGGRDANLIHGLYMKYEQESRKRGLIK